MRFPLAVATLAVTLGLGSTAAFADETTLGVAATTTHRDSPFSLQGFGTAAIIVDEAQPMVGVELGYRVSPSLQLEVDYGHAIEGLDRLGVLGTNVRWLAVHGAFTTYLCAGVAVPMDDAEPVLAHPILRTGFGGEWNAKNGVFVSAQLGVDLVPVGAGAYPVPEGRVGLGVRF
jgi:hypothetical protein